MLTLDYFSPGYESIVLGDNLDVVQGITSIALEGLLWLEGHLSGPMVNCWSPPLEYVAQTGGAKQTEARSDVCDASLQLAVYYQLFDGIIHFRSSVECICF